MKTWLNKELLEVVSFIQKNYIYCIICLFIFIFRVSSATTQNSHSSE